MNVRVMGFKTNNKLSSGEWRDQFRAIGIFPVLWGGSWSYEWIPNHFMEIYCNFIINIQ